eukprot:3670553-Prorocentrum_lima.AAC.1
MLLIHQTWVSRPFTEEKFAILGGCALVQSLNKELWPEDASCTSRWVHTFVNYVVVLIVFIVLAL